MKGMERRLADLVAFETVGGDDGEIKGCYEYIDKSLKGLPLIRKDYESNGKSSVVWLVEDTLNPRILLNAHIDVVPASKEMFTMRREGKKLIGRGVSDMKFAVAVFVEVLKEIYEETGNLPNLGVMLTSDEEVGGMNGVGYLVNDISYRPEVVVIPDGGDNWGVVIEAKGVLHIRLECKGESAHASRPWEGKSAVDLLIKDLAALRDEFIDPEKEVWETTMNIGQIRGGVQTNQVCDLAEARLDFRYVPKESLNDLRKRVTRTVKSSDVSELVAADPFWVDEKDVFVSFWRELVGDYGESGGRLVREHGASDGRYFTSKGVSVILSKPKGGLIHTEGEWLAVGAMERYKEVLKKFVLRFG